ncbi:MAG TPA: hypothetical protein VNJ12_11280 [Candidatus Dormibacteraeota bacterium]|nr:hypothetical protein [Candidatus Dormibacteraeota bacterium]
MVDPVFCPNCGIEYRAGFTRCNDCDVDLVEALPSESSGDESAAGEAGDDSLDLLWRGTQGGIFNEICLALEEAGIRFNQEKLDARLNFTSDYAPLDIWVPAAEREAARKVLDETLERINQPVAHMPESAPGSADEGDWEQAPAIVEDPHPDDATAEAWSGEQERTALFLKSCLAANGIGCYVAEGESGTFSVRVLPEDETRAKEIVRQVVEGIAPE